MPSNCFLSHLYALLVLSTIRITLLFLVINYLLHLPFLIHFWIDLIALLIVLQSHLYCFGLGNLLFLVFLSLFSDLCLDPLYLLVIIHCVLFLCGCKVLDKINIFSDIHRCNSYLLYLSCFFFLIYLKGINCYFGLVIC
jgi:hypothetical protein